MIERLNPAKFKPMLSAKGITPYEALDFDAGHYLGSVKLDGIRATNIGTGTLLTRTLKDVPNRRLRELLAQPEFNFLDGELIYGAPNAVDVYHRTYSAVMTEDRDVTDILFFVFDCVEAPGLPYLTDDGLSRWDRVQDIIARLPKSLEQYVSTEFVRPTALANLDQVKRYEFDALDLGFEGVMLRRPDRPYKFGRSSETPKQQGLMRRKPLEDGEAEILGFECSYENTNQAFTNELGRTARSQDRSGMVPKDTLGRLRLRDLVSGQEFWCGIFKGFKADDLVKLWAIRDKLPGLIVKYQFFPIGVKEAPRHPRVVGFRSKLDM